MVENSMRISLLQSKNENEKKYKDLIEKEFDYEKNTFVENEKYNCEKFNDKLVDKFYKCEPVNCFKTNFIKKLVSKQKIRFISKDFDLDLV